MTQLNQNTSDLQSILDAVNALPEAPSVSGEVSITEDGIYDVSSYAQATVDVVSLGTRSITANGTYDVTKYETANVDVPPEAPVLLWTNASYTSAFAAQTVSVASGYSGYLIQSMYSTSNATIEIAFVPVGSSRRLLASNSDQTNDFINAACGRVVTAYNGSVVFKGGRLVNNTTNNNSVCIPLRIWGVKFTL